MRNEENKVENVLMCYHLGRKRGSLTKKTLFVLNLFCQGLFLIYHVMKRYPYLKSIDAMMYKTKIYIGIS